jgi:hypothetical protein
MISLVKTQQFILLFSTTRFGLKGHHRVEHKIKIIYIYIYMYSLYGIEISRHHNSCCYVSINMGRIALGNRIYTTMFTVFKKDWMKNISVSR